MVTRDRMSKCLLFSISVPLAIQLLLTMKHLTIKGLPFLLLIIACNSNQESNNYISYSDTAKRGEITTGSVSWVIPDSVHALLTKVAEYRRKYVENALKFDQTNDERYASLADKYEDSAHHYNELFDRRERQFRVKAQTPVSLLRTEEKGKIKKTSKNKKLRH